MDAGPGPFVEGGKKWLGADEFEPAVDGDLSRIRKQGAIEDQSGGGLEYLGQPGLGAWQHHCDVGPFEITVHESKPGAPWPGHFLEQSDNHEIISPTERYPGEVYIFSNPSFVRVVEKQGFSIYRHFNTVCAGTGQIHFALSFGPDDAHQIGNGSGMRL